MAVSLARTEATPYDINIYPSDPLIWYHGRWDADRGTWWNGSGFKLHVKDLTSLSIQLGPNTTESGVAIGFSVNYRPFTSLKLTRGTNKLPLSNAGLEEAHSTTCTSIIRLHVDGWENNNLYLEKLIFNPGAQLLPYTPSPLSFQFIGDSLSSGQYLPAGIDSSWTFLIAQAFKAEHRINAQPGASLADMVCWGNVHGMEYQFFRTEDTGYFYTPKHNYTTPWDFAKDYPASHVFVKIGANDSHYKVTPKAMTATYIEFVAKLRTLYPVQPIFIVGAWGWPNLDGSVRTYFDGVFEAVVSQRHAKGDTNVYFIDTKGWVKYEDTDPDNYHPTISGHKKISGQMKAWLEGWGLHPEPVWPTQSR